MDNPRLDTAALKRFIASLSDSLHSLCNGCMVFDSGIEIVGYINVNIDKGSKLNYVLDEKVERSIDDSITYESNSFLAEKNQSNNVDFPVPDIPVSKSIFSSKKTGAKRKSKAKQLVRPKKSKRQMFVQPTLISKTASSTSSRVMVGRGQSAYSIVKTENNELPMLEPSDDVNDEEDDPTFDIGAELKNAEHSNVEYSDGNTAECFQQLEDGVETAGAETSTGPTTDDQHRWIEQILEHEKIQEEPIPGAAPPLPPPPPKIPRIKIPKLSWEQTVLQRQKRTEKIVRAMQETRKGTSLRRAAKMFGIANSTLGDYLRPYIGKEIPFDALFAKNLLSKTYSFTTFSNEQENQLITECHQLARLGYPYSAAQVIELAQNEAMLAGSNKAGTKLPTIEWFYKGFIKRHPDFNTHRPKTKDKYVLDDETITTYFIELDKAMNEAGVKDRPLHIWNLDETGVILDPTTTSSKVVSYKHGITAGKSPNTTLISAASAIGEILPPYFVYKGLRASETMQANTPEGTVFKGNESGWPNSLNAKDFITNHFCQHVTRRPILLLYDGYNTHFPTSLIEEAKQQDIHLFVLPPHSKHCVFERLKQQLAVDINMWASEHPMQVLQKEELPALMCTSRNTSLTVDAIVYGFRKSGVFDSRDLPLMYVLREAAAAAEISSTDGITEANKKTQKSSAKMRRNVVPYI